MRRGLAAGGGRALASGAGGARGGGDGADRGGGGRPAGGRPRDARRPAGLPALERRGGPRRLRRARSPGRAGLAVGAPGRRPRGRPCHGEAGGRAGRPALEHGRLPARSHRQPLPPAHARLPRTRYPGAWGPWGKSRGSAGAGGAAWRIRSLPSRLPRADPSRLLERFPRTPRAHEPRIHLLGPMDRHRTETGDRAQD